MATFITSKLTGETIDISVQASTGYWKYNHNGTDSSVFNQGDGSQLITVENANGEFTIIPCTSGGTVSGDITILNLDSNQLTSFDGTGLSGLTELDLRFNQLTSFDGTGLFGLTELDLRFNQLTSFIGGDMGQITYLNFNGITTLETFDGTGLSGLTELDLQGNQLTSFDGTGLSSLVTLDLQGNQLISFIGTGLSNLTNLLLYNNYQLVSFNGTGLFSLTDLGFQDNYQLTTFIGGDMGLIQGLNFGGLGVTTLTSVDVSGLSSLVSLNLNNNPIIASANDSILDQLEANGLENGTFLTTGGRTAAGTGDYDTLISRGWTIEGADLVSNPVWYRFKALGTQWINSSGQPNNLIKQVSSEGGQTYLSNGYSYFDFLTDESFGTVTFVDGNGNTIVATPVQVTLQEFSSSGSFITGVGFDAGGGNSFGYGNTTVFGNWGTLNSGTLPAIPSRYEGDIPAGSIIFSDVRTPENNLCLITAPILLSLTVNGNEIDLKDVYGTPNGTGINQFGFGNGDNVTFDITWGELVEATPPSTGRKLRVKGVGQLNP